MNCSRVPGSGAKGTAEEEGTEVWEDILGPTDSEERLTTD